MAVCWLSARTCSLLPSSPCFSWCVSSRTQLRLSAVSGANVVANGGEGSAFPFSRDSPLVDSARSRRATALHSRRVGHVPKACHPPVEKKPAKERAYSALLSYTLLLSVCPTLL